MLYRNDEIFNLKGAPEERAKIEKFFHKKFPVKVIYPPNRITPSRLKHNRHPDKPASISFDLKATVKTSMGSETWRYAENVIIGEHGKKEYLPKKFQFDGVKFLDQDDIELIYFLLFKSPHRYLSDEELNDPENKKKGIKQAARPKFMFEDLISAAEKRVEAKKLQQKIDALLYGELALSEETLREVATAMWLNVEGKTFAQVRLLIGDSIPKLKGGVDEFFKLTDGDEELKKRCSLQKLINADVLHFDSLKKTWYWKGKNGKEEQACKLAPDVTNGTEALYDHYKGDAEFREDVQAMILSRNPKAGKVPAEQE